VATRCPRRARGDVRGGTGQVHGGGGSPMQPGDSEVEEGSGRQCFRSMAALRCTSAVAARSEST
jgi:hypothetical protein